ncbi:MAG: hypothetical protein PHW36_00630 [Bacilli bacterium]|nr:hypothetical protein [Bacilli bacterium]
MKDTQLYRHCDECGALYPVSELSRCRNCKTVCCPTCKAYHHCPPKPQTTRRHIYKPRSTKPLSPRKFNRLLLCLTIGALIILFSAGILSNLNLDQAQTPAFSAPELIIINSTTPTPTPTLKEIPSYEPHIIPDQSSAEYVKTNTFTFKFQDITPTISTHISSVIYYGAASEKSKSIYDPYDQNQIYYYYFTNDPLQEATYQSILIQSSNYKDMYLLSDDEYVEFLSCFVQSIPYHTEDELNYPIETLWDQQGDCDDKSMLLAGLLTRAGYDVVLLSFDPEEHMTVGIKTESGYAYPNTGGYAVIETTDYSYVTEISENLGDDEISLTSKPVIIDVGTGTKPYTSGAQVKTILDYKDMADVQIDAYDVQLSNLENQIGFENNLQWISQYNDIVDKMNDLIYTYNMILDESYNRVGVYEKIISISL